jgi:hypothetical protein
MAPKDVQFHGLLSGIVKLKLEIIDLGEYPTWLEEC